MKQKIKNQRTKHYNSQQYLVVWFFCCCCCWWWWWWWWWKCRIQINNLFTLLGKFKVQRLPKSVKTISYMPTLPDYPGVSRIRHQSPGLPYGSPYLPDKIIFWAFMCVSLRCSPFLAQNWIFRIRSTVSGAFLHLYLVIDKDYFWHQNANFDSMYVM